MKWIKLIILSLSLSFFGCIGFYLHPKGGFRPKKPKFSLAKEKFVFNKLIDTTAIYISLDTLKYNKYKSCRYIKFYNNGRVMKDSYDAEHKFTKESWSIGIVGYYTSNENDIKIEGFYTNSTQGGYQYIIDDAIIKGDSIIFNNKVSPEKKDIYIKQKLNFKPEPSNW